jgi:hypothetical protein
MLALWTALGVLAALGSMWFMVGCVVICAVLPAINPDLLPWTARTQSLIEIGALLLWIVPWTVANLAEGAGVLFVLSATAMVGGLVWILVRIYRLPASHWTASAS